MAVREVATLLSDQTLTWPQRLTRLQGWRGADAECADAAPFAQRIGPAACAVGSAVGGVLGSPVVLALFAATALIGAVAPNHPFEAVYNRWARARGRQPLPPNRAARRLGCAIGFAFLGAAAIAYLLDAATFGLVLALVLACTAAFVAITGICVPSMLYTAVFGVERACAPRLLAPNSFASATR